jgi:hypothetical protein
MFSFSPVSWDSAFDEVSLQLQSHGADTDVQGSEAPNLLPLQHCE